LLRVDFTSQNFFRDPAAAIEKLRAAGPVVEVRLPIFGRVWTTTQEMASHVLKDNRVFTLRTLASHVLAQGTITPTGAIRIVERTHYYAKLGLAAEVLDQRRKASAVRVSIGLPAGEIFVKRPGGDGS